MNPKLSSHKAATAPRPRRQLQRYRQGSAGPASHAKVGPDLFLRLDVSTASIAISLAPLDADAVRCYVLIGGAQKDLLRLGKNCAAPEGKAGRKLTCSRNESYPL